MHILVVAATTGEVAPLAAAMGVQPSPGATVSTAYAGRTIDVLVTGVGMVATAVRCAATLSRRRYDLALDLGVCGAFNSALAPGTVVHVISESLSELGAEDGESFLSMEQLGLADPDEYPFVGGRLVNQRPPALAAIAALPAVYGITVNTVHGRESSIADVVARFRPDVESMEGAAFAYACLVAGVPFAQVRAVSNRVERRNRSTWNLAGAIEALGRQSLEILEQA